MTIFVNGGSVLDTNNRFIRNILLIMLPYVLISIFLSVTLGLGKSLLFIISFIIITAIFASALFIYLSKEYTLIQQQSLNPKLDIQNDMPNDSIETTVNQSSLEVTAATEKIDSLNDDYAHKQQIQGMTIELTSILKQVMKVASDVESIAENSYSVLEFVKEVQGVGLDTLNSAKNSNISVTDMIQEIDNTSNVSNNLKEVINRLRESSNSIGDIISNITKAAKQTHLLALNASIEAARGGGNREGFSVIAAEMAKLATQSENSANEISHVLVNIQKQIYDSFELVNFQQSCMETTVRKGNGIINAMDEITVKTENVAQKISETVDLIEKQMSIIGEVAMAIADTANTANQLCDNIANLGN